MKKILFLLLLFTIASYGQAVFDEGIQITNTESITATKVNVQEADGTINYILKSSLIDVIEVNSAINLSVVGVVGKIYITKDNNKIYRWNGTFYQELAVPEHNSLSGLQGGTAGEYNHLTNAQVTKLNNAANDSDVLHKTGNESKNAPLNFTYPIGSIANSPLTIKNYGGIFGANNDIPVELIKLSYAGLFSMNYKYQPDEFGVAYVPYDTTFPMHSFEAGREGLSVHGMAENMPDGSSDNNLDDRMVWKAGARGVRTTAPNSLVTDSGTWIQNFTGVYAENINDPLKWSSGASTETPFEYYRKQGSSSTPSFLNELSGDNNSPLSSVYRKSRGTLLTPTATIAGDSIYLLKGQVYDGSRFEDATFIKFSALANATGSNSSGKIVLGGAKTGTTEMSEWVSIDNGDMNVDRLVSAKDVKTILNTSNDIAGRFVATETEVQLSSSYGTTGSFVPLKFYTSDTERMSISTSGIVDFDKIPTAPTAPAGTNTTQLATTAFVQAKARPYKVYTALLTQTGTNAPTATVLENTLGGTVTFERSGVGNYNAVSVGNLFTLDKTVVFNSSGQFVGTYNFYPANTSRVALNNVNVSGVVADSLMQKLSIEIRVYF